MRKSECGSVKRACAWSACARTSAGRSRGSWIDMTAAMIATSRATPSLEPSQIMRARRGSMGSCARTRPTWVRRVTPSDVARAPSSVRSWTPSRTARVSGGSTNGKRATSSGVSTTPTEIIWSSTDARLVRRISGSVNSGREKKSSSE
ncbi:Uncharacterised protein [Mycobacteroides abscessus]|nr:Uncharacterised protein [Mycobacteroides abscessus]